MKTLQIIERACAYLCIGLILAVRSLLGPASCRYPIGCTAYAVDQLKTRRLLQALWKIFKRVASCNLIGSFISS